MEEMETYESVLRVFASYGFGKASMAELASAANVSRQTLYNRFSTKKAVLNWAVNGFSRVSEARALERLSDTAADAETALAGFFHEWLSGVLPLLRASSHGAEILDLGIESERARSGDRVAHMTGHLADFMLDRGLCQMREDAEGRAFLLIMASKGLLLECPDIATFRQVILRAVRAALLLPQTDQATSARA